MKRFFCAFLAFLCAAAGAQSPGPVAVDISALVTNMNVQITWKRAAGYGYSPDMHFRIYRDTSPLTRRTIGEQTLVAEQDASQLIFSEELPDSAQYYYAVLAVQDGAFVDGAVIPAVNATVQPVSGRYASRRQTKASKINNFSAIPKENAVIITYTSENRGNRLALYRSQTPFTAGGMGGAVLVGTFTDTGSPLSDYPPAETSFYYALAEEAEIAQGGVSFADGVNTQNRAVKASESAGAKGANAAQSSQVVRRAPLPAILAALGSGASAQNQGEEPPLDALSAQGSLFAEGGAQAAGAANAGTRSRKEPFVFPQESGANGAGVLAQIVGEIFAAEKWAEAEKQLSAFVGAGAYPQELARAHFYLGETFYFMGNKRQALLHFLNSREQYPLESAEWIDAVLAMR